MYYSYLDTPIGPLLLAGTDAELKIVGFSTGTKARQQEPAWERNDAPFADAKRQLNEYFEGTRQAFDLPLAPLATPFQGQVLDALQAIPYGETRSYKDIAVAVGNPKAVRAVGTANGNNPIPIIIPCHRVIGSDGSLTGFGGGLETKRFLLALESNHSGLFA